MPAAYLKAFTTPMPPIRCQKVSYANRKDARKALGRTSKVNDRPTAHGSHHTTIKAYRCDNCGNYHLGHGPLPKTSTRKPPKPE